MLVNLSKSRRYRSQIEMHRKALRKTGWYKRSEINLCRFENAIIPTQYVGVYESDCQEYFINDWCRQRVAYGKQDYSRNAWDFGVADNVEQIIDYYNNGDFKGNHVIFFYTVYRNTSAPCCGWRWHKWGEYIGEKKPTTEYLNDEPEIDKVIIFSIYKVM